MDISSFIGDVPGRPAGFTRRFSTSDASGSTSQAAAICEAVEAGATTLLFDEDTCATNFMIRDERMARLVADDREPIVPFVRRAAALSTKHGVSSILVLGGTGDYFSIADAVVVMDAFSPRDATADAKALAGDPPPMPADAFRATPRTPKPGVPDGRTRLQSFIELPVRRQQRLRRVRCGAARRGRPDARVLLRDYPRGEAAARERRRVAHDGLDPTRSSRRAARTATSRGRGGMKSRPRSIGCAPRGFEAASTARPPSPTDET